MSSLNILKSLQNKNKESDSSDSSSTASTVMPKRKPSESESIQDVTRRVSKLRIRTKLSESKPSETKPSETKPSETKPSESKTSETKTSESKTSETKTTSSEKTERFTHGIYGIMVKGPYKGYDIEIKEFYPGKLQVEIPSRKRITSQERKNVGDIVDGCKIIRRIMGEGASRVGYTYQVACKITIYLSRKSVVFSGRVAKIIKGEYKGKEGRVVNVIKPKVKVYVDAPKRFETVTLDHIFYNDILLKSGNYFNVQKIKVVNGEYIYEGLENDEKTKFITKEIVKPDEISKKMPGFKVGVEAKETDVEMTEEIEYTGTESDSPTDSDVDSETESIRSGDEGDEMVSEINVSERVSKEKRKFTSEQKAYVTLIETVLKANGLPSDSVNTVDIIEKCEAIIGRMGDILKGKNVDFDVKSSAYDKKIIISLLVAYDLVQSGIFPGIIIYVNTLINRGFFQVSKDINTVLFRKENPFEIDIEPFKELRKRKKYADMVKLLVENYNKIMQDMLKIAIPLGSITPMIDMLRMIKSVSKDPVKKYILVEDIMTENVYPLTAERVIWGPNYMDYIKNWKGALDNKIKQIKSQIKSSVNEEREKLIKKMNTYVYVMDNTDKLPLVIRKLQDELIKTFKSKYEDFEDEYKKCADYICREAIIYKYLEDSIRKRPSREEITYYRMRHIYINFYNGLKDIYDRVKGEKEQKIKSIEIAREMVAKRREEAMQRARERELLESDGMDVDIIDAYTESIEPSTLSTSLDITELVKSSQNESFDTVSSPNGVDTIDLFGTPSTSTPTPTSVPVTTTVPVTTSVPVTTTATAKLPRSKSPKVQRKAKAPKAPRKSSNTYKSESIILNSDSESELPKATTSKTTTKTTTSSSPKPKAKSPKTPKAKAPKAPRAKRSVKKYKSESTILNSDSDGETRTASSEPRTKMNIYKKRLLEILNESDLSTISAKQIRLQIEKEYGVDLKPHKKEFDELLLSLIPDQTDEPSSTKNPKRTRKSSKTSASSEPRTKSPITRTTSSPRSTSDVMDIDEISFD